ncbi:MAG: Uma2 family endonuclease, partial [Microcystis sp. LE19-84.1B]|nr:Uma2 family endonuclease [Microcystis sp. LE19-84.1B]MCZ8226855.1 Uma2 family endonuclease [Microcystis sp. LE19-84.1B]
MLAVTTSPETLSLEIPTAIALSITLEQFEALAAVNRDLKLERTVQG